MHVKQTLAIAFALALPAVQATYQCPISTPEEVTALNYAYVVQDFLFKYFNSEGEYTADDFSDFPNASMMTVGNVTTAEAVASNMNGLKQQAKLGIEAIQILRANSDNNGYMIDECNYSYPPLLTGGPSMDFVQAIYYIEATLCGAFIGLADYVQTPQAAFLMARLAAEHGIHASFLGHYFNPTPYSEDSMALTPAFTPDYVLEPGTSQPVRDNVGHLGAYIPQSCAPVPSAPCGGTVEIGDLVATLSSQSPGVATATEYATAYHNGSVYTSYSPTGTGYGYPYTYSSASTYVVATATGAAADVKGSFNGMIAGVGGVAAALAML